jgi:hypothetical protein
VETATRKGRTGSAIVLAAQQRKVRAELAAQRTTEAKALAALQIEKAGIDGERKVAEADLGPVRYLATLLGDGRPGRVALVRLGRGAASRSGCRAAVLAATAPIVAIDARAMEAAPPRWVRLHNLAYLSLHPPRGITSREGHHEKYSLLCLPRRNLRWLRSNSANNVYFDADRRKPAGWHRR